MKDEADNEKQLISYLLGNVSEEQRLQIEEAFLREDQSYERLLALESELFYDYSQNKLSPGEREQFEKRFLSSERNRKRAMLVSALARKMSEAAPVETAEGGAAGREPQRFRRSLKSYFAAQGAAMRVSLAALAATSFALIWLAVAMVRLRNEFNRFRERRAVQEDQPRRQNQQARARAEELSLDLKREADENAMLRQELARMRTQSEEQGRRPPSVISLVLTPSIVRDQASGMKKLYLAPGAGLLRLRLKLNGGAEYKSYQATLLTAEGFEKWSQTALRFRRTGSRRSIDVSLPVEVLAEGDYKLRLKGYAPNGTLEETGDYYYLSIRRK